MKTYDVAIIGGGLLGCFAARNLCRYKLSTVLIEQQEDVCRGISRANSAIVYPGYDNKPGSIKARMTVKSNAYFHRLCDELEVPFIRRGSLLLSYEQGCDGVLEKKLKNGIENGVPELKIISGEEAMEIEPMLSALPRRALYCPGTGTVNPWQLGIAAFESAITNGCEAMLSSEVLGMEKEAGGYIIKTDREEIRCRALVNCAGLHADKLSEMLFEPELRLRLDASDFLVFDKNAPSPGTILFEEGSTGKALSLIPTVEGNLLIESALREYDGNPFAFREGSRTELLRRAKAITDCVSEENIIRCFAAVRPNLVQVKKVGGEYVPTDNDFSSFAINRPEPGFISFIGIKSPGLTCANELGMHAARELAAFLGAEENKGFISRRPAIRRIHGLDMQQRNELAAKDPDYGDIVCLCEDISKAEIKQAIARGARSLEAVKRRLGTSMGPCQGSRCSYAISKILEAET